MNYYIIRYTNGYSDLIITDANEEEFDKIIDEVEDYMDQFFFDPEGDSKTDIVARELRLNNFTVDFEENIPEYKE